MRREELARRVIEEIRQAVLRVQAWGIDCRMPECIWIDGVRYEVTP